jgi:hypothetical protein
MDKEILGAIAELIGHYMDNEAKHYEEEAYHFDEVEAEDIPTSELNRKHIYRSWRVLQDYWLKQPV